MLNWETFRRRRDLDVAAWVKNSGIVTYEDLVGVLTNLGVEAPTRKHAASHILQKASPTPAPVGLPAPLPAPVLAHAKAETVASPSSDAEPSTAAEPERKKKGKRKP